VLEKKLMSNSLLSPRVENGIAVPRVVLISRNVRWPRFYASIVRRVWRIGPWLRANKADLSDWPDEVIDQWLLKLEQELHYLAIRRSKAWPQRL
jgi:hypothetical protein